MTTDVPTRRVREVVSDFGISATASPGKYRVRIIEGNRWGSTGYYPGEVVKRDGPKAFEVGTHVYFDHPTFSEEWERPERSVRDLVGTVVSTPEWNEETQALEADVEFAAPYVALVDAIRENVGMSIHAFYDGEYGNAPDGQYGEIITAFIPSPLNSVDVVTRAGAGGKILQAIESATVRKPQKKEETVADTTVDPAALTKLTEAVSALAGAVKADREERKAAEAAAAEKEKADPYDVALAVSEAKLPKAYAARAVEAVKNGTDIKDAIESAQAELDAVLKEVGATRQAPETKTTVIGAPAGATTSESVTVSFGQVDISDDHINRLMSQFAGVKE